MTSSGTSLSLAKTLLVPAVISLVMFLLLTFVLVPIWRRYRNRYAQYLPLDSISERTSSLRHRIMGRFATFSPFATFVGSRNVVFVPNSALDGEADDGEELDEVDEEIWRAIERHVPAVQSDSTRRLSREYALPVNTRHVLVADCSSLEEGFMDDSDEEPVPGWP